VDEKSIWRFTMAAMATYTAQPDTYAGFGSTGKYFGYFALAGGALGLTGWAAIHGHLLGLQPSDAGTQLLLMAMEWIGTGLFVIMALAVLGSIQLSSRSRGTVTIDDLGVVRQIGGRSRTLLWHEIEGFAATPISGGITLIPRKGNRTIVIPRFLDDYRGCLAEIKSRGVESLPANRLKRMRGWRRNWRQALLTYSGILSFIFANSAHTTHAIRLMGLLSFVAYSGWLVASEELEWENRGWLRWGCASVLMLLLAWLVWNMMHTW
jgi:hypothetical protein